MSDTRIVATASGPRKVVIDFVYPPIPIRRFDYAAYFDDDGPEGPTGDGATAEDAINDLLITAGEDIEP